MITLCETLSYPTLLICVPRNLRNLWSHLFYLLLNRKTH
jgi:hypothetical protein